MGALSWCDRDSSARAPARDSSAARARFSLLLLLLSPLVLLAGCGFGEGDGSLDDGSGGSGGGGGPPGGGGGAPPPPPPPQIPLEEGQTVGEFEVVIPNSDDFILRGTLPIPPGVYDPLDGVEPFGVVDTDGLTYGAQAEVVAWYPNDAADGASVVEIIARVSRGGLPFGTRTKYRVVLSSHAPPPDPGTPGTEDLLGGPPVPVLVETLLSNPGAIELRSYDCFGNKYVTYPLNGAGEEVMMRHGEHAAEMRVYQHLAASPPVSGSTKTLNHWLGVHAYVGTWDSEEFVTLDLRVSNADSGNIPTISVDDPLDKVYFRSFEVAVPTGWVVVQDFDDPYLGAPFSSGSMNVTQIVEPLAGGKLHVLPWGWQFHRRLVICRTGFEAKARDFIRGAGLGFNRQGLTDEGPPLWSWWNPNTARFFPQSHLLPIFDHLGQGTVAQGLVNELNSVKGFLEGGGSAGDYPVDSGVLGWAHPYGIAYGGMTGGAEINIFDGVKTAWAAEVAGYQKFRIIHRMQSDRQHNVLFNWDGEHTAVEDWLKSGSAGPYVPFEWFVLPHLDQPDDFGLSLADKTHINYVQAQNLDPDYEADLLEFEAHDYQHFIRYTRSAKVLTWLANDSVAKDDLRWQAENFKLAYHQYNNSDSGSKQGSGFANALKFVDTYPGKGFGMGRGESWGLDASNAAYATSSRAWRAERKPWFDLMADNVSQGQADCSGFVQAVVNDKILDGNYRARQGYEHPIIDNAIAGMLECVYRGLDSGRTAMLTDVLADSYYALVGPISWSPSQKAPWQMTAVGPTDPSKPLFCTLSQLPGDGYTPGAFETFQNWSDFAYAYELTNDSHFLDCAWLQIGSPPDLLTKLEMDGLSNIENRTALLAILQHENGDF